MQSDGSLEDCEKRVESISEKSSSSGQRRKSQTRRQASDGVQSMSDDQQHQTPSVPFLPIEHGGLLDESDPSFATLPKSPIRDDHCRSLVSIVPGLSNNAADAWCQGGEQQQQQLNLNHTMEPKQKTAPSQKEIAEDIIKQLSDLFDSTASVATDASVKGQAVPECDRAQLSPGNMSKQPSLGAAPRPVPQNPRRNQLPRKPSLKFGSSLGSSATNSTTSSDEANLDRLSLANGKRTVSFGKLEAREYNIALSDNPSVSCGPAIQLGWDFTECPAQHVEDYEESREPRRTLPQLVLSNKVRRYLLLKKAGYSKNEIREAVTEIERVKRGRVMTDMFMLLMKLDELWDDVTTSVKGIFARHVAKVPMN
jgi:hypothetical protein